MYHVFTDFIGGTFTKVFSKLGDIFKDAVDNRLNDWAGKCQDAQNRVDSATMLLSNIGNYDCRNIKKQVKKDFLTGYLYCRIRLRVDHILNNKDTIAVEEKNFCNDCKRWMVPTPGDKRDIWFSAPLPKHIPEWIEWRCKRPSNFADLAIQTLSAVVPKNAGTFKKAASLERTEYEKIFEAVCYWDVEHIASVAECLVHSIHPEKGILFYPCRMEEDEENWFGTNISDYVKNIGVLKLPDDWNDFYLTVTRKGHNGLLWIERSTRQVMIYDGFENRNGTHDAVACADTVEHWLSTTQAVMRLFGLLGQNDTLNFGLLARKTSSDDIDAWQLISITQRLEEWNTLLIAQQDEYSCGAIAVAHLWLSLNPESNHDMRQKMAGSPYKLFELIEFPELWKDWYIKCTKEGRSIGPHASNPHSTIENSIRIDEDTVGDATEISSKPGSGEQQNSITHNEEVSDQVGNEIGDNIITTSPTVPSLATVQQSVRIVNYSVTVPQATSTGGSFDTAIRHHSSTIEDEFRTTAELQTDASTERDNNSMRYTDDANFNDISSVVSASAHEQSDDSNNQTIEVDWRELPLNTSGEDVQHLKENSLITGTLLGESRIEATVVGTDPSNTQSPVNFLKLKYTVGLWYGNTENYNSLITNLEV